MTEKELIHFLKTEKAVPPQGAVERCLGALPEVKKSKGILPLLKLQLKSLPAGLYILSLAGIAILFLLMRSMDNTDSLVVSGLSSALLALAMAWHLTLAATGSMDDIERCCKYSYGQILLSRILCLCLLTLAALLGSSVPAALNHHLGVNFVLASILPTALGALAAIWGAGRWGSSDLVLMAVYLVTALVTSLTLQHILYLATPVLCLFLAAILGALCFQSRTLINRRIEHEAYHY